MGILTSPQKYRTVWHQTYSEDRMFECERHTIKCCHGNVDTTEKKISLSSPHTFTSVTPLHGVVRARRDVINVRQRAALLLWCQHCVY